MVLIFLISGSAVDALILEAPYTRIGEVVARHPLIKVRPVVRFLSAGSRGV